MLHNKLHAYPFIGVLEDGVASQVETSFKHKGRSYASQGKGWRSFEDRVVNSTSQAHF